MMLSAKKIKAARTKAALTMQQAGEAAGFPPETARQRWHNYESGREDNPKLDIALRIAAAVRKNLTDILK